jgi:putative transposase
VEFIAAHRGRFGVERMCRVLGGHGVRIAPSMYYAAEARPPSARAVADAALLDEIVRVHADPNFGRGLDGARKIWHRLRREGVTVPPLHGRAADAIRRPARGLAGPPVRHRPPATPPRRGRRTGSGRDFTAAGPDQLWVVDVTDVPAWSGSSS